MPEFDTATLFRAVDLAGVFANGVIGGAIARRFKLDPVGFIVLAVLSGLGGGLIRDTLLQAGLPVALADLAYLVTALLGALVAYLIELTSKWPNRFLRLLDAASVGCWSSTGTIKALSLGVDWLPSLLLGVVTAVGGGVVRDVVVGRMPEVFRGTLYATNSLLCAVETLVLVELGHPTLAMGVSILTSTVLVILARRLGWELPGPGNLSSLRRRRLRSQRPRRSARRRPPTGDDAPPPAG